MNRLPSSHMPSGGFGGLGAESLALLSLPMFQMSAIWFEYSWNGVSPVTISMAVMPNDHTSTLKE